MKFFYLFFPVILIGGFFALNQSNSETMSNNISPLPQKEERKVYTGAWVGGFWNNETKHLNTKVLSDFEEMLDTKIAFTNIYSEWEYLKNPELIDSLNEISDSNWTPIISSNPYFFDECQDKGKKLYKTLAHGDRDEFLKHIGQNLKNYKKTVFLRFAWEMNLPDMYWSIDKTGSTPEDFKNAWIRLHSTLKEEGADNVVWVLSFNTSHAKTVPYKDLYPGDSYVDWVAIDGYNWGNSYEWSGWADFSGVFYNSYEELLKVSTKPVMLSEVNSAQSEFGGDKAKWLTDMLDTQIPQNYPRIQTTPSIGAVNASSPALPEPNTES